MDLGYLACLYPSCKLLIQGHHAVLLAGLDGRGYHMHLVITDHGLYRVSTVEYFKGSHTPLAVSGGDQGLGAYAHDNCGKLRSDLVLLMCGECVDDTVMVSAADVV